MFKNDKITLIKSDSRKYEDILADVQKNKIFIDDINLPIEEGDVIIRELPNKLKERYIVIDRCLYTGHLGHYEVEVRRESMKENEEKYTNINFYGNINNSQIQQNVSNSSQVWGNNTEYEKKDDLEKYLNLLKENIEELKLDESKSNEVNKNIKSIELELKEEHPKSKLISEGLSTIRNVLEGVTGSLIASGLIYQLSNLVK